MSEPNESLPTTDAESPEAGDIPYAVPPKKPPFRLLFLIVMTDMLGFGILLPLLPDFARQFHASDFQVTLMLSIYSLFQFIAMPILGSLSDRVGRRPILIYSQAGSAVASITLAIALSVTFRSPAAGLSVVYLSRLVDGFTGGNLSAAQAYMSDVSVPQDRAKNMGILGAAFGIGFVMGPALGGLLGSRHLFLAPLGAACFSMTAAVLSYLYLPESLKAPKARSHGRLAQMLGLLRHPALAQINLIWFISMFAFVTAESVFALFLADQFGLTKLQRGLIFALAGVTIVIVQGRLIGPLTRKFGEWGLAILGPVVFAAGMFIYFGISIRPLVALLFAAVIINAFGRSLQTPALSALVVPHGKRDEQGTVFGLFQGVGSLARVVGPAIAGVLYSRNKGLPYLVAGCLTLVAAGLTIALRAQRLGGATTPSAS